MPDYKLLLASAASEIEQSKLLLVQVRNVDGSPDVMGVFVRAMADTVAVIAQADSAITNATGIAAQRFDGTRPGMPGMLK